MTSTASRTRHLFLCSLGFVHLIAFWSYYVQFPGLLSAVGIEPVHRLFPFAAPTLYSTLVEESDGEWIDEDSLCELCAIFGMMIGGIIASGTSHYGILFLLQTALYSLLVQTGGTFYSFQWDTLLIETTFVTALTFADWNIVPRYNNKNKKNDDDKNDNKKIGNNKTTQDSDFSSISPWPLRFLLFKLMYMSGVVKLQANCPTWLNLTALEYHFATQCLPGPLAWHAHQLHPFLLRLGVAFTLWIEMPAALLLLVPNYSIRRVAAVLQMLLQVVIILTGNYNFFNILTMALCLPVMERDDGPTKKHRRLPACVEYLIQALCWTFLIGTFCIMFRFEGGNGWNVRLVVSTQDVNYWTGKILPLVINATLCWVAFQTILASISTRSPRILCHGLVCLVVIGIVAIPMTSIFMTANLRRRGFWGFKKLQPLYQSYIAPHGLSNGYGLFRRMTGVGSSSSSTTNSTGWAGLAPSVVARPEIVFECMYDNTTTWHELEFRWKPGAISNMPRRVAPHQPRLDWQMWFAALGSLNQNPWLVHFAKKILDGCQPAMDLLAPSSNNKKCFQIRAKLYHYDFTRIESKWSKSIPGAEILPSDGNDYWSQLLTTTLPKKVWHRTFVRYYMPPLEPNNESLTRYLQSHGYNTDKVCTNLEDRCLQKPILGCHVARLFRARRLYLAIPLSVLVAVLLHLRSIKKCLKRKEESSRIVLTKDKKNQ